MWETINLPLIILQAYLLKNDENKAMTPAVLQNELNNILKFNPDFAEAVGLLIISLYRTFHLFVFSVFVFYLFCVYVLII